jgi:hypothetical protein
LVLEALAHHLLRLEIVGQTPYFPQLHLMAAVEAAQEIIQQMSSQLPVAQVVVVLEIRFLFQQELLEIPHLHRPLKATTEVLV